MIRIRILVGLAGCCTACVNETVTPLPELEVRITSREVWAGDTIHLESRAFEAETVPPRVVIGDRELDVVRLSARIVAVALPHDMPSGTYDPEITVRSQRLLSPAVRTHGLVDQRSTPLVFREEFFRRATHTTRPVVVGFDTGSSLAFLNLESMLVTRWPELAEFGDYYLHEVGASYRGGTYAACPSNTSHVVLWNADGASPAEPTSIDCGGLRSVVEVGPGRFALGWHHETALDPSAPRITTSSPVGGRFASTGDRMVLLVQFAESGLPVYAAPSGSLLYQIDDVPGSLIAEFSPDGRSLAVVGSVDLPGRRLTNRVMLFNADNGSMITERELGGRIFAMAFDPVRPWIYAAQHVRLATDDSSRMDIAVIDRGTLDQVARISVPLDSPPCESWYCARGVIATAQDVFYLAVTVDSSLDMQVFRFSLPTAGH